MTYTHVIYGIDNSGTELFYTGKAGEGWVSPNKKEAFTFTKDGAQGKAKMFNRNTELHGIYFIAMEV